MDARLRELGELADHLPIAFDVAHDPDLSFSADARQRTLVQVPVMTIGLPSRRMLVTTSPLS